MKAYIKLIYAINTFAYFTTLVLFLTVYLGMYAHFFLGIIQLIIGLSLFTFWKEFESFEKKIIKIYWLIVISWFLITFFSTFFNLSYELKLDFIPIWLFVIPMSIATYQFFITLHLKKKLKLK